jgi:glycosyltransferase involved in cell wall biosynthesis
MHLSDLYFPVVGGAQTYIRTLSSEQARRGAEVHVVTISTTAQETQETEGSGVVIHRVAGALSRAGIGLRSKSVPTHPPFPDPLLAKKIRALVEDLRPEVIFAHNWIAESYLAIKRHTDPPLIYIQHDYSRSCAVKSALVSPSGDTCSGPGVIKCLLCAHSQYQGVRGPVVAAGLAINNAVYARKVDAWVAISSAVKEFANPRTRTKAVIIPPCVPDDVDGLIQATPRPDYLPGDGGFIYFAGVLSAHKGLLDLLAAYELLGDEAPPLVVAGLPRSGAPTTWPSGVLVRESVAHEEVLAGFARCAFGVVPSHNEPFGLTAVECGAAGRAVIVAGAGGLLDIVEDGVNGLVVSPRDPGALAAAMKQLLGNPEEAARMGKVGRERAKKLRAGVITTTLDELCARVLTDQHGK